MLTNGRLVTLMAVAMMLTCSCRADSIGPVPVGGVLEITVREALQPHEPIAGADVTMPDLSVLTSGTDGVVLLPLLAQGEVLEVMSSGHVNPHRLLVGQTGPSGAIYLLPNDARMSQQWLMEAYYASNSQYWLWRPEPGILTVETSDEARGTQHVFQALEWGMGTINRAQDKVSYQLVHRDETGDVQVYRDPDDPVFLEPGLEQAWAVAILKSERGVVTGGRIVFKFFTDENNSATFDYLGQAMAHEFAHLTSIIGHPSGGIMEMAERLHDFSDKEKWAMAMAFLRPPGNRPPDNSADAPVQGVQSHSRPQGDESEEVLVCVLRH
jgi:hypothetical protein